MNKNVQLPELFVIGDSISMHYGPYLQQMLQGKFRYARKTGAEPAVKDCSQAVRDANGGDSQTVLEYVQAMAKDESWLPDVLLLNCGLHDIKINPADETFQVPLENYKQNLKKIVQIAQDVGEMIWVRTTPVNDQQHLKHCTSFIRRAAGVRAYNAAADEIMLDAGISTIDLNHFTVTLGEGVYADHVHFNEDIMRLQAAYIAGFLNGSI
jgi:hypothetical protein